MIQIWTDGSSSGGVGPGGYGWIIVVDDQVHYAGFGSARDTTNNLMELEGAIQGLLYLIDHPILDPEGITLVSDSMYVLGIANGDYTPQKNLDSTMKLRTLATLLDIKTQWVRGHAGEEYNEIADSLAKMGKRGYHRHPRQKNINKQKRKELHK